MRSNNYKFEGWLAQDEKSVDGNMVWGEFEPKTWEETDVDIRVTHCGICGSDLHCLRSGWGPMPYPIVVGHEIVGIAVRVGSKANEASSKFGVPPIQVGDRVGVGAQSDSCQGRGKPDGHCKDCDAGEENYCDGFTQTYGDRFKFSEPAASDGEKSKTMGGYAQYTRQPGRFVIKIPEELDSATAAPMLCGGVTMYSPLSVFGNRATGQKGDRALEGLHVGIVGVGGLGHFGIIFAKALGAARVTGISRRANKRKDALQLGCDEYIATAEDKDWVATHSQAFDLIVSTVSSSGAPLSDYLSLLKRDGSYVQVGNPDDGNFSFKPTAIIMQRVNVSGSAIGSPREIREMLELAAKKQIKPWIQELPMNHANQAVVDMAEGKARYRYVLVNPQQ